MSDEIPLELTMQMGRYCLITSVIVHESNYHICRPISQGAGEIRGFVERASYLLNIAPSALADVVISEPEGVAPSFKRYIRRAPMGVVLIVSPWKYVTRSRKVSIDRLCH